MNQYELDLYFELSEIYKQNIEREMMGNSRKNEKKLDAVFFLVVNYSRNAEIR